MKHVLRIAVAASAVALIGIHYFPERRAAPPPPVAPVAPVAKPAVAVAPKPAVAKPEPRQPVAAPAIVAAESPPDVQEATRLYALPHHANRPPGRQGPTPARSLPTD